MKKTYISMAAALVVAGALSSCGNKNKSGEQAADTVAVEEIVTETPADMTLTPDIIQDIAKIFSDESKKADVATDSTYAVTASGLKYVMVQKGSGIAPKASDAVTVHYTGMLTDGKVFDSSVDRGQPATFPLNRVIPGWTEGVQLMKEGAKYTFFIPSDLAYGAQGVPNAIPPHSTLIFDVELIKVVKK